LFLKLKNSRFNIDPTAALMSNVNSAQPASDSKDQKACNSISLSSGSNDQKNCNTSSPNQVGVIENKLDEKQQIAAPRQYCGLDMTVLIPKEAHLASHVRRINGAVAGYAEIRGRASFKCKCEGCLFCRQIAPQSNLRQYIEGATRCLMSVYVQDNTHARICSYCVITSTSTSSDAKIRDSMLCGFNGCKKTVGVASIHNVPVFTSNFCSYHHRKCKKLHSGRLDVVTESDRQLKAAKIHQNWVGGDGSSGWEVD
jgi:hypothetical protein